MLRLATVIALAAVFLKCTNVPSSITIPLFVLLYIASRGLKWIQLVCKTFPRDLILLKLMIGLIYSVIKMKVTKATMRDFFHNVVQKHPNKLALVMADTNESLTFKEAENFCFKIANTFYEAGYRKGDVIAVLMENRIEYMLVWMGLSMIGVVTSLINYNLKGDSLKHCIDICNCKAIIFSKDMKSSVEDISDNIAVKMYCFDNCETSLSVCQTLPSLIDSASCEPPPKSLQRIPSDVLVYMYTSGTTGFPKAVKKRGEKILLVAATMPLYGLNCDDTLYQSLPLYHLNGMIFAHTLFLMGCTIVIKKKFSATQFMADCSKYNATVINYIGETCQYILSQPKSVYDELNRVRFAIGNGLRASIWTEFKTRFKIDTICELYASTEGNTVLFPNIFGKVGAIGCRPLILPNNNLKLVKVDKESGDIIRGPDGLALEAGIGEPGQAVGKITKTTQFDGYTNEEESKKKIGYDLFTKGDSAFLSGDLLVKDEEGYYYFHDRTGDTFRWKGENVSTTEVEGLISKVIKLTDVCVYGVEVPGTEGKAGMACICDPKKTTNIDELPKAFNEILPKYAQPVFLRLTHALCVTGTYKFEKKKLQREGFNPNDCALDDVLYYFDGKEKMYRPLDDSVYQGIMNASIVF